MPGQVRRFYLVSCKFACSIYTFYRIFAEIDHTAYTVSTVGAEGFLNLLPIYLNHLFFPTLTVNILPISTDSSSPLFNYFTYFRMRASSPKYTTSREKALIRASCTAKCKVANAPPKF